ncbi:MAG: Crp/Fnr family transcriptional regulator [Pseudolabrys sp.]
MEKPDFQGCSFCLIYKAGLCGDALAKLHPSDTPQAAPSIRTTRHTIPKRQMIHSPRDFSDVVICICAGQAVSSVALPDGRRQILEVLLPGDIIYWTALFEPMSARLIEATENSTYRKINRGEFFAMLAKRPDVFQAFIKLCIGKKDNSDQLALTLGRRNALQRIARFILDLATRLIERGLATGQTISFPLRLRHIADATGLTPVHTSKVLRELRREKIIDLEDRSLTVFDMMHLRQIAGP